MIFAEEVDRVLLWGICAAMKKRSVSTGIPCEKGEERIEEMESCGYYQVHRIPNILDKEVERRKAVVGPVTSVYFFYYSV